MIVTALPPLRVTTYARPRLHVVDRGPRRSPAGVIGLELQTGRRALEDVPTDQLSDDTFHEAVVQMEPLRETRGGDRIRRAENNGNHPPLQAVELDANGEGFKPVTRDRQIRHCRAEASSAAPGLCPSACSTTVISPSRGEPGMRHPIAWECDGTVRATTRATRSCSATRVVDDPRGPNPSDPRCTAGSEHSRHERGCVARRPARDRVDLNTSLVEGVEATSATPASASTLTRAPWCATRYA